MADEKKDLIITLADTRFIAQAKQLFASVYFNAGWQGDYMLLTHNISLEDKTWFEQRGIIVYSPPLITEQLLGTKKYIPLLLSKLYFFKEEFKKWRKIIFLDADIIVQASLDELLQIEGFVAVKANTFKLRNEFLRDNKSTKLISQKYNLNSLAFNTGVFVFDTKLITPETFSNIIKVYDKYKSVCEYGEESVLNLFFYKNWKQLSVAYNSDILHLQYKYGLARDKVLAVIAHFCCAQKPWDVMSPYYQTWTDNLHRAEEIDLANRPQAAKVVTSEEIVNYDKLLKKKKYIYPFIRLALQLWFLGKNIFLAIDTLGARFGLFIKQKNPKLYNAIKLKK